MLLRSDAEQALLQKVLLSGGVNCSKGMYVPQNEPGFADLLRKGLLRKLDFGLQGLGAADGWYSLTDYAKQYAKLAVSLTKPLPLLKYARADIPLEKKTEVELIHKLAASGWVDQETRRPKSVQAYDRRSDKVWWRKPGKGFSIRYFRVLASSEDLFAKHPELRIHHFQPNADYDALLQGHDALPNHCLDYYKCVMKGARVRGRARKQTQPTSFWDPENVSSLAWLSWAAWGLGVGL